LESEYEKNLRSRRTLLAEKRWREMDFKGDANTSFFHLVANGRRKNNIFSLEHEGQAVTDHDHIQTIIYDYYKKLFGKPVRGGVKMMGSAWSEVGRLDEVDNTTLLQPFTEHER
jgi:hypothetical protein